MARGTNPAGMAMAVPSFRAFLVYYYHNFLDAAICVPFTISLFQLHACHCVPVVCNFTATSYIAIDCVCEDDWQ